MYGTMEFLMMGTKQLQRAKMQGITVRALTAEDVEAIIEIGTKVMSEANPEYWQHKLARYLARQDLEVITATTNRHFSGMDPRLARVAEVRGRVVGFIIGEIRSWEFRQPPTGWITTMAVDPDYQRQGIGRRLVAEVLDYFREKGIENVHTIVTWSDGEMLSFFTAMGFDRGPFIELEKKLNLLR
jgi:ribosomal protein S18 acetylase RimI-like enzyme